MKQQTDLFELIVRTLTSNQEVNPCVVRAHIQQYAELSGVSYSLAVQAIVCVVRDRITKRLEVL